MIDQIEFQEALGELTRASGGGRASSTNRPLNTNPLPTTTDGRVMRDIVRTNTGETYTTQEAREACVANRIHPLVAEASAVATAVIGDIPKTVLIGVV